MAEKNRRLIQGQDIIYPFTRQENVIGLQKTITDKLPIVSVATPEENFVEKQVWLDIRDNEDAVEQNVGNRSMGTTENNYGLESSSNNLQNGEIENNYEIPIEEPTYNGSDEEIEENYEGDS